MESMLKSLWEEVQRDDIEEEEEIDVSEELGELKEVYEKRLETLEELKETRHKNLIAYMRSYLDVYDKVNELEQKRERLMFKMGKDE